MSCLLQDGKEEAAVCLEEDTIDMNMAIADEGKEEVNNMPSDQKSHFFKPAAKKHRMDTSWSDFPCSLLEDKGEGGFYQDAHKQTLPILNATIAC